jgi:hypothetical protein
MDKANDVQKITIAKRMSENNDFALDVIENMDRYGGSFVRSLAQCALRADPHNLTRLVSAFYDYFAEYESTFWQDRKSKLTH